MTMPPMPTWYRGREAIAVFLRDFAFAGLRLARRGRPPRAALPGRASGQLALGAYGWDQERGAYLPTPSRC